MLSKSSLNISLLPESSEDQQMAALMKLQSRPAIEIETEKRLDILTQPTLPSFNTTSFGGLKQQKLINKQLDIQKLGIIRKESKNLNCISNSSISNSEAKLSLVCNYSSSQSDSDN